MFPSLRTTAGPDVVEDIQHMFHLLGADSPVGVEIVGSAGGGLRFAHAVEAVDDPVRMPQ